MPTVCMCCETTYRSYIELILHNRRNNLILILHIFQPPNDGVADAQAVTEDQDHPGVTPAGQENIEGAMEPVISTRYVYGMSSSLVC